MRKFLLMAIFVLIPVIANAGGTILLLDAATATGTWQDNIDGQFTVPIL